jgi:hypothetical protein
MQGLFIFQFEDLKTIGWLNMSAEYARFKEISACVDQKFM